MQLVHEVSSVSLESLAMELCEEWQGVETGRDELNSFDGGRFTAVRRAEHNKSTRTPRQQARRIQFDVLKG